MTVEEEAVQWSYKFTDYIGHIINESSFDKLHDKYPIDSNHVRQYLTTAFIEGAKYKSYEDKEKAIKAFCSYTCPGKSDACRVYGTHCKDLERYKSHLKKYNYENK